MEILLVFRTCEMKCCVCKMNYEKFSFPTLSASLGWRTVCGRHGPKNHDNKNIQVTVRKAKRNWKYYFPSPICSDLPSENKIKSFLCLPGLNPEMKRNLKVCRVRRIRIVFYRVNGSKQEMRNGHMTKG